MKTSVALAKRPFANWSFLFLWISVTAGAFWIQWTDSLVFVRFLGDIEPLPVSIMDLPARGVYAHVLGPHFLLLDLALGLGIYKTAAIMFFLHT